MDSLSTMKAGEKCVKTYTNFPDLNCSVSASHFSCNKHPYSSSVGICPHCLNDRLMKLVCSDCCERHVSSCSCSDIPLSYRNSCSNVDVGSVGRISFLIDNDKIDRKQRGFFRRSSSNSVEAKKISGVWRIKKLFTKRTSKRRGGSLEFPNQISSFLGEARNSGFGDILDDEFEVDRVCSVFPFKERDFSAVDEKGFIEIKLDSSCAGRSSKASDDVAGYRNESFEESLIRNGISGNGGSCRITKNEIVLKQGRGNYKAWKWIFKSRAAKEDK